MPRSMRGLIGVLFLAAHAHAEEASVSAMGKADEVNPYAEDGDASQVRSHSNKLP